MQVIFPADQATGPLESGDVADRYPWPDSGTWVRALMVTTLDGSAVGPDGRSKTITGSADQAVFVAVRGSSDAVLVGAQTLRAEEYGPMRSDADEADQRTARGQLPAPVMVVVSGSLDLPWSLPFWSESTQRPMIVTSRSAEDEHPDGWAAAHEHADVVALDEVTPDAIVRAVGDAGLRRIVCEGGPGLLRNLAAAGLVDEADITVSPAMTGTEASPSTDAIEDIAAFTLTQVLEESGYLMCRYVADR